MDYDEELSTEEGQEPKTKRPRQEGSKDRRRSEDILVVTNQDRTRTITLEEEIVPRKSEIKIDCNAMPLRGKCFLCTQPYTGGFGSHLYSYHHKKIMLWSCNFCREKRTKKEDLLKHMYDKHRGHSGVETREAIRKTVDKYPVVEVVKNKFFKKNMETKQESMGLLPQYLLLMPFYTRIDTIRKKCSGLTLRAKVVVILLVVILVAHLPL